MAFLDKIKNFIDGLDERDFFKYMGIFIGCVCLIISALAFRYYIKIGKLTKEIRNINHMREDVKDVLDKAERVKMQRAEVDSILAENEDFILEQYFEGVRNKLRLTYKIESRTTAARDEKYQEVALNVKFSDMNMKQLTELLQELEKSKRIYTKDLEIRKSKKRPGTIDVTLTIATLKKAETV